MDQGGYGRMVLESVNLRNMFFSQCDDLTTYHNNTYIWIIDVNARKLPVNGRKWLLSNRIWSYDPVQAWVPKPFFYRVNETAKRKTILIFPWAEHNTLWFFYSWSLFTSALAIDGASAGYRDTSSHGGHCWDRYDILTLKLLAIVRGSTILRIHREFLKISAQISLQSNPNVVICLKDKKDVALTTYCCELRFPELQRTTRTTQTDSVT